jgi:hypothetical protein
MNLQEVARLKTLEHGFIIALGKLRDGADNS